MADIKEHFFLDILDSSGFPDLRVIQQMRANKESVPETGVYYFEAFVDRGFLIYGMRRPLKLSAYRKLSTFPMSYQIFEDRVEYETYYSLNNSDTDPYLIRVNAVCSIDHVTLGFPGEALPLIIARYERSFIRTAGDDAYQDGWFASMEQRIGRRENVDRYPYSLVRAMSVIYKAVHARELRLERTGAASASTRVSACRRLPSEEELKQIPKDLTTPRELGRYFYQALTDHSLTADELSTLVDRVLEVYHRAVESY